MNPSFVLLVYPLFHLFFIILLDLTKYLPFLSLSLSLYIYIYIYISNLKEKSTDIMTL